MHDENKITYFAETDARNRRVAFGIKAKDRLKHVYVIGKTGMGKSTLLENMAIQDIQNGEGMCFIDPHGKTADLLLEYIPEERIKDVVWFAPFDADYPISFNVMEDVGADKRHLVASGLMSAFKKIWVDAWSARMEYILTNTILALLEYPDSTLIGVNKMLSDKEYRKKVVDNITDASVKSFWVDEFAKYGPSYMQEAGAAIQNKIGQFLSNPIVRNVIGQPRSSFDIRKLMDEKKILIVNLSKGLVGEVNANLLGSMLITKLYLGAMSRADTPEAQLRKLPNFYLYVDEFQSFANESFANILSEARKYKLNLTIAHQYIEQMSEEVRAAVIGNVGTMIVFRVGAFDAQVLEKEFAPTFMASDLVNLGVFQIYLKLMIDGVTSPPFSATTLPPIKKPESSYMPKIIEWSRTTFAQPKARVEEEIRKIHGLTTAVAIEGRPERSEREGKAQNLPERKEERREEGDRRRNNYGYHEERRSEKKNPFSEIKLEQSGNHYKLVGQSAATEGLDKKDTISFSELKGKEPEVKKAENKKEASPKNVQTLRDALSSVLKKSPVQESSFSQKPKKENSEAKHTAEQGIQENNPPGNSQNSMPREVPEKVLRQVLEVDGDHHNAR